MFHFLTKTTHQIITQTCSIFLKKLIKLIQINKKAVIVKYNNLKQLPIYKVINGYMEINM